MTHPISPPPVTAWQPDYLPAYLSNGMLGLRVGHIPCLYGVALLSGFEGLDPITGVEAFARAPYPLAGDVQIGEALLSDPHRAVLREQQYDFSCGELRTKLVLEAGQARADIEMVTLCSRTQPTLVLQETRVRVDCACDMTVSAGMDAHDVPGYWEDLAGSQSRWRSPGNLSTCGVAYDTEFLGADQFERSERHQRIGPLTTSYSLRAKPGVPRSSTPTLSPASP